MVSAVPVHGRPAQWRAAAGFTLLEVLIALLFVALALGALMEVGGGNARNVARIKDKTIAQWVATNKATEWRMARLWPNTGRQSGTELMAGREWRWVITVNDTPDPDMRRLDIAVYPDRTGATEPVVVHTAFVGRP